MSKESMLVGLVLATLLALVYGHGYMIYPAQRSSLWRYGIYSPVNLKDNEIFCGGLENLWTLNGGKCGECGDPFQDPRPRKHEAGGVFGKGIIFKEFKTGEIIDVEVELTSNHKGWFEFRLCPLSSPGELVTQACFDQHPLHIADGVSGTRYFIPNDDAGKVTVPVKLPEDVICDQCVMQWWWNAATSGTTVAIMALGLWAVDHRRPMSTVLILRLETHLIVVVIVAITVPILNLETHRMMIVLLILAITVTILILVNHIILVMILTITIHGTWYGNDKSWLATSFLKSQRSLFDSGGNDIDDHNTWDMVWE